MTAQINEERCNAALAELIAVFQKYQPTVGELLLLYGNLGYSLGASIGGLQGKGPNAEELKKLYYTQPGRLDVALMLEGLTVTSWLEDWEKLQSTTEENIGGTKDTNEGSTTFNLQGNGR